MAIAAFIAFTCGLLFAQAPDKVKENFRKDNPNAMSTVWKAQKDNTYRVTYTENKMELATVYDKEGNVVSRQKLIKNETIPAGITDYYSTRVTNTKEYAPSYTVWQTTDKDGNVTYYSEYNGKSTYFDKEGKVMTRQGMAEGDMEKQDNKMPVDK